MKLNYFNVKASFVDYNRKKGMLVLFNKLFMLIFNWIISHIHEKLSLAFVTTTHICIQTLLKGKSIPLYTPKMWSSHRVLDKSKSSKFSHENYISSIHGFFLCGSSTHHHYIWLWLCYIWATTNSLGSTCGFLPFWFWYIFTLYFYHKFT